jgi:L,D-peptidoglycan transpeptidase YkuD (ErfK/YbiS/YcfS/YnhG family)
MAGAAAIGLMVIVGVGQPSTAGVVAIPVEASGAVVARLPLDLPTGDAQQVITIDAPEPNSSLATLRAWERVPGGWQPVTAAVTAHTAVGGLTAHPSEHVPATPIGSFTLTQAFGKLANPGAVMPYFQLTAGDWWVDQPGPLYNTHQLCTVDCPFLLRSPNTHLMDTLRAYNYALVIDYNRFPVVQGAGSAYFLHVTTAGRPTDGCIGIPQPAMAGLLRWLRPSASPRILIGVG